VKIHGHERDLPALVVNTIRREKFIDECVVTSFDWKTVDEIKKLAPKLKVGYIFGWKEFSEEVFAAPVELLSTHYSLVDAGFVERAHFARKKVHVWTVNYKWMMRHLRKLGVDGIITNYPDRLREA